MAQFLRGKQAGIQKDLSEGLSPTLFALDEVCFFHQVPCSYIPDHF